MSSAFSSSGNQDAAPVGGRPNSIGLSDRNLVDFVDELDRDTDPGALENRPNVRWPFARTVAVGLREAELSPLKAVAMACRSISSSGMQLLHNGYVHEKTPIRICLKNSNGKIVGLDGTVVSCRHLRGTTHGIGVQFGTDIDINDFIELALVADSFMMEHLDLSQLRGRVVVVDSDEEVLGLMRRLLGETPLQFRLISSMKDGLKKALQGCDLILCDEMLKDGSGLDLIAALRDEGSDVPVLIMTDNQAFIDGQAQSAANAVMPKPITRDVLLRCLAEFLLKYEDGSANRCTLPDDHASRRFVSGFLAELAETADQLQQAIEAHDFKACHDLCIKVAEASPPLGYQSLGSTALSTARALPTIKDVQRAAETVGHLIELCRQAEI